MMVADEKGPATRVVSPSLVHPARRVMLIRHGEKPHDGVRGVKPNGRKSRRSLTPRGWQRAGALAQFFREPGDASLSVPSAIYASRIEAGEKSRRPRRTVEPLAALIGVPLDHRYGDDGERELVATLLDVPGPVLICWHHEGIPDLCRMIAPGTVIPNAWPGDRFDLVWVLDQDDRTGSWSFAQVPQMLLAGDRGTTI